MVTHVKSCTLIGIDAALVEVECEMSRGLPQYQVVGMAATSVKEGAVRIRSALSVVGEDVPLQRVTINLAPADLRKPGAALDLPIAAAVLAAASPSTFDLGPIEGLLLLGELGLDGTVRAVRGVLAAGILAKSLGLRGVLVPSRCAAEALVVDGLEVYGIDQVSELTAALKGTSRLRLAAASPARARGCVGADMADVRGQAAARAAIEVAVAGGHNILLAGPPGTGKTMLARRIPTVLPPMTRDEALATTKVYSAIGMAEGLVEERPFRSPHHTISAAALLGGGSPPRPGEISLAHNGVLFLDEMPEFARGAIEGLRQPLEDREVVVARVNGTIRLPASFLLAAAANPCPCGWLGSGIRECTCATGAIDRYRLRLSGPLLDRIDLQINVPPVALRELRDPAPGESSAAIRERVIEARARQVARLAPWGVHCNAEMTTRVLRATCRLDGRSERALDELVSRRRSLTARSVDRILKVARTIADLQGLDTIDAGCLLEAAVYREPLPSSFADLVPPTPPVPARESPAPNPTEFS